ncbi:hypothetical protein Tco_0401448 [Tanacetum coccineum]
MLNTLVQKTHETTKKIVSDQASIKPLVICYKSYPEVRSKPKEFQEGDRVMLKPKRNLLLTNSNFRKQLELPQQLSRVHNTFHVSNLKKCLSDEPLAIPLDEINIDDKLHFIEEPVEEVKRLKQSRIAIVKVRWNSRRGFEFTWERKDQFRKKYPHLFTKTAPSTSAAS